MWILPILIRNFGIVLLTELPLGFCFDIKKWKDIFLLILLNIITNPLAVLIAMYLTLFLPTWQTPGIIALELLIVLTEGFLMYKLRLFSTHNPYGISLVLNAASFAAGELIKIFL